ncbi:MAG: glycoside hydrolase family 16 protein [Allomuricauda sp.]|nr:MAG: glycoside hydrolase family 16 protein [Allomuricauda sp.]
MKHYFLSMICGILLLGCSSNQAELIFAEEFDAPALNEEIWSIELGDGCPDLCGWGNNEPQIYTNENHMLEDGFLTIRAKHENDGYTSTRITTKDKFEFKYGKIEARIKLPVGNGVWPAFWMLGSNIDEVGWPKSGEIDIMEYVGKEPNQIFTSLHTQSSHGNTINTRKMVIDNIEDGFHIYTADWSEDKIEFAIDGEVTYTYSPDLKNEDTWPFDQPFYVLVNLAIGGHFGGDDIDNSIFPQEFVIDYIRVYKN